MAYAEDVRTGLRAEEGVRAHPYHDSEGILSIGIGRNLEAVGLRADEIEYLFENDIREAEGVARALFPGFDLHSDNRRVALVDMAFNLGRARLSGFHQMIAAVNRADFEEAARQMAASRWASQVGNRALRLEKLMREG